MRFAIVYYLLDKTIIATAAINLDQVLMVKPNIIFYRSFDLFF